MMKAYGITHRGAVRTENQDTLRVSVQEERELLTAVLCDGMGGARGGALASSLAADTFMYHAVNSLDELSSPADMKSILVEAIDQANTKVYDRSFADLNCMGMGSTLVALLSTGRRTMVAHVGDSRAYLLTKDRLRQITRDHSLVEELVAKGRITREQARVHPKKNIITRAVGVEASVRADVSEVRFLPGCRLLLCSDGLTNTVTDGEIQDTLRKEEDLEDACGALLELSLQRGAPDNVSVLVAQH